MKAIPLSKSSGSKKYVHFLSREVTALAAPVNVLLAGVGGTGSILLSGLARMNYALRQLGHVGLNVHVMDADTVSENTIGRQLFSPADLGLNKAVVQCTRLNNFFGTSWRAYPFHLNSHIGKFSSPVVISCVDKGSARIEIAKELKGRSLYWLDCGNSRYTGQVILGTMRSIPQPALPNVETISCLPTVIDLYPDIEKRDTEEVQGPACSLQRSLEEQDFCVNFEIANCAMKLLWKAFRTGKLTESGFFINIESRTPQRALIVDPNVWMAMGYHKGRTAKHGGRKAA